MTKGLRNRKGFTLVEVIIVLVVLAILAAIMIPALTGWISESKQKICVSNRSQLLRYFQYEQTLYYLDNRDDVTLANVLAERFPETANDVKGLTCPSGGTYTAVGDVGIYCSVHGLQAGSPQEVLSSAMKSASQTFGAGTGATPSTTAYIDSTAPNETGKTTKAAAILAWLADKGIDLTGLNVQSWKLQGKANGTEPRLVTWTDQKVAEVTAGTYVRAISYDAAAESGVGAYTVGYLKVETTRQSGGSAYNRMKDATAAAKNWYADEGAKQYATYEEALAAYGLLEEKK